MQKNGKNFFNLPDVNRATKNILRVKKKRKKNRNNFLKNWRAQTPTEPKKNVARNNFY